MWLIFKFDKKKINLLKQDLKKITDEKLRFYSPKILLNKYSYKRNFFKEYPILGDYIFCFHKKFSDKKILAQLNYCRGIKYLLNGFNLAQNEISEFINQCQKNENKEGYLSCSIYEDDINKIYKFKNGPFSSEIFKIIELQKNKLKVLLGNIKINIKKKNYFYLPA